MNEVTRSLSAIEGGDPTAARDLLPLVYDELRKLAAHRLANERPGQTLQATALVHEAYLRLVDVDEGKRQHWNGRGHFFAAAAEGMRRILVERARRRSSVKHGGGRARVDLGGVPDDALAVTVAAHGSLDAGAADADAAAADDLLALDEALRQFEDEEPAKAQLVKLRYFAGLSVEEAAQAMGISSATAKRHWVCARSWLYGKLRDR
jgi:RNA polymerase sigma factor (sigma-70 family)